MDIFKAIKLEKKYTKRFFIIMGTLSLLLPLSLYLTALVTPFYLIFLAVIEFLIFVSVIYKINHIRIAYSCIKNRLKYKVGLFSKENLLFCDKVAMVHTTKMEEEMEIVVVTTMPLKNRGLKPVYKSFYKRYSSIMDEYNKLQKNNPNTVFYYQVIKRGGLKKYLLLDCIYKNCVKAIYTNDCIQNIKIARGQTLV